MTFRVRGAALGWFASYFNDRRHSVVDVSAPSPFVYGVPQGSFFGDLSCSHCTSQPLSHVIFDNECDFHEYAGC